MPCFNLVYIPGTLLPRREKKSGRRHVNNSQSSSSFGSLKHVDDKVRKLLLQPNDIGKCQENPLTHQGKRIQLTKIVLITLVPIISLAVLAALDLQGIMSGNAVDIQVRIVIRFSRDIGVLLSRLQRERDMTALYISVIGPENTAYLTKTYPLTDSTLDELQLWPVKNNILKAVPFFRKKEDCRKHLSKHRSSIDKSNATVYDEIRCYPIGNSKRTGFWQILVAYQLLIEGNIDTGAERTLGAVFFSRGWFDPIEDYIWYLEKYNLGRTNFQVSKKYTPLVESLYTEQVHDITGSFADTIDYMRQIILNDEGSQQPNFEDAALWFDSMTVYIDILADVQTNMADEILIKLDDELKSDKNSIAVSIFLVVVVIIMCPLTLRAIWRLTADIQNYALTVASQTKALNAEKKRSKRLLHSMLPTNIAEQLMNRRAVGAQYHDKATVLFSDIVNFDRICSDSNPMQVVEYLYLVRFALHASFSAYDIVSVPGLPTNDDSNRPVAEMATAALDLLYHINFLEIPHKPRTKIKVRIGMHTGPVVAGVVGLKMPRYCLFGDTVNTASRMQSHSLPSRVHISFECRLALLEYGGYTMFDRGDIEIKGKGIMNTFWLTGKENFNIHYTPNIHDTSNKTPLWRRKYDI
uniref:Uncharacterized protein LOC100367642 n=1 Tax=Saccoglossus kowalevskii TaxID=10224 RepID=A0ABM0H0A8_SACKO|nr:PREDICTED: uncharacterized protein LOC100367642 [Saccoglossus kowalevskii]